MEYIEYFKLQAKNLHKDFETGTPIFDGDITYNQYSPKFFKDIADIVFWLEDERDEKWFDETNVSLMKAQHIIAMLSGFKKWGDLIHASNAKLELGKLLLDHRGELHTNSNTYPLVEDWNDYLLRSGVLDLDVDDDNLLELFKEVELKEHISSEEELKFHEEYIKSLDADEDY